MARLIVLGSAAAVSNAQHDNTHFVLQGDHSEAVLVDCSSNPLVKLPRFDIHPDTLTHMILTHFHPDHISGVPIMMMQMWITGRKTPLHIYGLHHCLHRVKLVMDACQWDTWPNFFPVIFHTLPERPDTPVLDTEEFDISAWPTKHFIPTIGLRIAVKSSGKVVAYSCDTEPIPNIVSLAHSAELLIHEASGTGFGHSSAAQAGEVAAQAGAKHLVLIHYDVRQEDPAPLIAEAQTTFAGPVARANDFDVFEI
ncbi:MAG: MBL fold metallo-hydrolase [Anaerolineae bacterium]|nr:MBL fold metallo-hydrolase [Anaerolineae bacterium]